VDELTAAGIPPQIIDNLEEAWANLAAPGAVWTGPQRLEIAAEARRARTGEPARTGLPPGAVEAARLLAENPAAARRAWVEGLNDRGLDDPHYIELLGVVSRVAAIDSFYEAVELSPASLPEPLDGEPSGEVADGARTGNAWVPMVGGTSITQALSLIPAENAELERFHGPMYLFFDEMPDPHVSRALTRPQMELVAARTSAINECFY
jgi:hypothetical protein